MTRKSQRLAWSVIAICFVYFHLTSAQSPVATIPQSQQAKIFTAATTAQASGCLTNQGQNIWVSNYIVAGSATAIQYRLEFSYDSDAATCSTGTWFQMSDDANDLTQAEVVGVGAYPYVRANLVTCAGCGGAVTVTSFYTTSSSTSGAPFGFYNPSQQMRKIIFSNVSTASNQNSASIPAPTGSALGFIVLVPSVVLTGSPSLTVTLNYGSGQQALSSTPLPTSGVSANVPIVILTPATPVTSIKVNYSKGTTGAGTLSAYYYFLSPAGPPASVQPPNSQNAEVSATHAAAQFSLAAIAAVQSLYVYSVSARCSAGSAQLSIVSGGVTMWSSGATEVGTTTFKFQWSPGLLATNKPGDTVVVSLSDCGAANVGTLDLQASVM